MESNLPFALRVAAYSVQLDYVKVIHTNDFYKPKQIVTFNFFGWEKRLQENCIKKINSEIIEYYKHKDNGRFYMHNNYFISMFYTKYLIFKCVDLNFTIDECNRHRKLRKIKEKIDGK